MTKTQIDLCLNELDEMANSWITFEGKLTHFSLQCDSNLFISPQTVQYYFDNTSEMMFVRHTYGPAKRLKDDGVIPDGSVSISHNGLPYIVKVEGGGCNDNTIGVFHEAISYELIVGMFRNNAMYPSAYKKVKQ